MKEKLIKLPDDIYEVLEQHKEITGRPITGIIQEALYRFLVHEKLIQIKTKIMYIKKERKEEEIPEAVKFCEGDRCIAK